MRRPTLPWLALGLLAAPLAGCAVASATAGAAISVAGAVVATGVTLGGKAVGAGIDALPSLASSRPDSASDGSGIVVREHIRPAAPTPAPGTGNGP